MIWCLSGQACWAIILCQFISLKTITFINPVTLISTGQTLLIPLQRASQLSRVSPSKQTTLWCSVVLGGKLPPLFDRGRNQPAIQLNETIRALLQLCQRLPVDKADYLWTYLMQCLNNNIIPSNSLAHQFSPVIQIPSICNQALHHG